MKLLLFGGIAALAIVAFYFIYTTPVIDNILRKFTRRSGKQVKAEIKGFENDIQQISKENEKRKKEIEKENDILNSFKIKEKQK